MGARIASKAKMESQKPPPFSVVVVGFFGLLKVHAERCGIERASEGLHSIKMAFSATALQDSVKQINPSTSYKGIFIKTGPRLKLQQVHTALLTY